MVSTATSRQEGTRSVPDCDCSGTIAPNTNLQQIHKQGVTADEVEVAVAHQQLHCFLGDELASEILMNEVYGLDEENCVS